MKYITPCNEDKLNNLNDRYKKIITEYDSYIERAKYIVNYICDYISISGSFFIDISHEDFGDENVYFNLIDNNDDCLLYEDLSVIISGNCVNLMGAFPKSWMFNEFEKDFIASRLEFEKQEAKKLADKKCDLERAKSVGSELLNRLNLSESDQKTLEEYFTNKNIIGFTR